MTLAVRWIGSPNYFPNRLGHNPNWSAKDPNTWIVDHTTVSTRASANARFTTYNPTTGASPTYMIDVDGTIYQYVRETDGPWTNGTNAGVGSNLDSITIEHVDNGNYDGKRDPRQIEASAQLHADIYRRRGIPLVHRGKGGGVIGHKECNGASTRCPDALPVDAIIKRANAILHPPTPKPAPVPVPAPKPAPVPPPAPAPPPPVVPPVIVPPVVPPTPPVPGPVPPIVPPIPVPPVVPPTPAPVVPPAEWFGSLALHDLLNLIHLVEEELAKRFAGK